MSTADGVLLCGEALALVVVIVLLWGELRRCQANRKGPSCHEKGPT